MLKVIYGYAAKYVSHMLDGDNWKSQIFKIKHFFCLLPYSHICEPSNSFSTIPLAFKMSLRNSNKYSVETRTIIKTKRNIFLHKEEI